MHLMFSAINGSQIGESLIWLVIAALIYFVIDWGLKKIGLPEPFNKIAQVILVLLVVVVVVNALLLLAGHPLIRW